MKAKHVAVSFIFICLALFLICSQTLAADPIKIGIIQGLSGPYEIYGKAEFLNPGGSVKDRAALFIIRDAEKSGALKPGGVVVDVGDFASPTHANAVDLPFKRAVLDAEIREVRLPHAEHGAAILLRGHRRGQQDTAIVNDR